MIIYANKGTVKAYIIIYYVPKGGTVLGGIFLTLDVYLDKRGISRYSLSEKTGIRYDTINKYYRNRVVRYDSYILAKICDALECDITDIICYQKDN